MTCQKILFGATILAVVAACVFSGEDGADIRGYPCYKFTEEPELDGKIDEAAWRQIPEANGFFVLGTTRYAFDRRTSFKAGWTSNALYIAAQCFDPAPEKIKAQSGDGMGVWSGDSIELFFCARQGDDSYLQFAANRLGAKWSAPNVRNPEKWAVKGATNSEGWCVEIRIPFEVLEKVPAPNEVWRMNIARNSRNEEKLETQTCWPMMSRAFNETDKFAALTFKAGLPSDSARVDTEKQIAADYSAYVDRQIADILRYQEYFKEYSGNSKYREEIDRIRRVMAEIEEVTGRKDCRISEASSALAGYRKMRMDDVKYKILMKVLLAR